MGKKLSSNHLEAVITKIKAVLDIVIQHQLLGGVLSLSLDYFIVSRQGHHLIVHMYSPE